jgi:hypothetical protein
MHEYTFIDLQLGDDRGRAMVLRDRLPQIGGQLKIAGACWEVVSARYGYSLLTGVEGSVACIPCV